MVPERDKDAIERRVFPSEVSGHSQSLTVIQSTIGISLLVGSREVNIIQRAHDGKGVLASQ